MILPPTESVRSKPSRIALVGNPNAGKTTLFNRLTGSRQKVANYPGVTVERATGRWVTSLGEREVVDVPGLYSLNALSVDEEVARDEILGEGPDAAELLMLVVDAMHLARGIVLYHQVARFERPVVLALTMGDLAEADGRRIDAARLSDLLGCPVVPVIPHRGEGLGDLATVVDQVLAKPLASPTDLPGEFVTAGDRFTWAEAVAQECTERTRTARVSPSDRIDRWLTHRVVGMGIFLAVMFLMFQSIYTLAEPLMSAIEWGFGWVGAQVSPLLARTPWLQSLVVDGLIGGIGSVAVFLPQILILFFFIAALEGSGYLSRAAFLMDRALGWCGLNGRAFIPLLSSFACAIPGIMAARVMPDPRSRLATMLVAPLMSCSARLPVYILLIGAIIEPQFGPFWAGVALFGMHLVGAVVAIPVVLALNRRVLRSRRLPFMLELPAYQWPKWRDVVTTMLVRAQSFVQTAGTIIVVMSLLIWALLYFPRSAGQESQFARDYAQKSAAFQQSVTVDNYVAERQIESSYLGQFGKAIEPVFAPAGFDWRISTAILAAFPAREVLVSSLGILFQLGSDTDETSVDLRSRVKEAHWPDGRPLFTPWTAVGLMVFFALCCQCGATLATIRRETGTWKWPVFVFAYMTGLAWLAAVGIHQLGRWLGGG